MTAYPLALRFAAITGALGLAVLGLRLTAVEILPSTALVGNPMIGDNPDLFFELVGDGRIDSPTEAILKKSRELASLKPLAAEPFLLAAADETSRSNDRIAEKHLAVALNREPRSWRARMILFQRFAERGETSRMTEELVVLSRLVPETNELFLATVGQLVINPGTRRATILALAGSPMIGRVLDYLANSGADPDITLQLARSRGKAYTQADRDWQARIVANLVADGQYARAQELWRLFLPANTRTDDHLYNSRFEPLPGSRPFNWVYADGSDDVGVAEPAVGGALEVVYYGRTSGPLASQLLLLPAGRYSLSYSSEGPQSDGSAELTWTVTCADRRLPLATSRIGGSTEPKAGRFGFAVPAGCSAIWLRVAGVAKEFSRSRSARISNLSLQEV